MLVDAPVAARIAANDAAHWKGLGAAGFLFSGVYDTLDGAPQKGVQDFGPTAPESALLKEIRLSVAELKTAGIERNFLRVSLGPDAAWFSDRNAAKRAISFFEGLGIFCLRAGLQGIALDLRTDAPFYQYRWPGHGAEVASSRLEEGAREFGRRSLRAFIRQMPDADLLFIADNLDTAGPLFYSLLEGLVESVGAAQSIRMDLLLRLPRDATRPDAALRHLEDIEERICGALPPEPRRTWQLQGGYAPVLEPLAIRDGTIHAAMDLTAYRVALAGAKLAASDHVVVRGAYGTWWNLGEKQARAYRKLLQRGESAAAATPLALAESDDWDFRTPFDTLQRVGCLREMGGAPYAFLDGVRSAVLFSEAPKEALAADNGVAALLRTDVATREEKTLAVQDGRAALGPSELPAVVRGLPLNAWAAPASLWCAFDAVPGVGVDRVPVRFGLRNVYPGELSGNLRIETPDELSLGLRDLPVLLKPGAAVVFEKALQGTFSMGDAAQLRIALESPISPGVSRGFRTTAHLRSVWEARRDGEIATPPLVIGEGATAVFVVASEAGDVAGYARDGALLWQRRYPPPVVLCAWPGRGAGGTARVAMGDATGGVHVVEARGTTVWDANAGAAVREVLFADVFALGTDAVLAVTTSPALVCLGEGGRQEWRYASEGPLAVGSAARTRRLQPTSLAAEDRLYLTSRGERPALMRLGGHGQVQWRRDLPGDPVLSPVLLPEDTGAPARVLVPLEEGKLALFSQDIGAPLPEPPLPFDSAWRWLEWEAPGQTLLAASADECASLDVTLGVRWRAAAPGTLGMTLAGTQLLALDGAGQLRAFHAEGGVTWMDRPPLGLRQLGGCVPVQENPALLELLVGTKLGKLHLLRLP